MPTTVSPERLFALFYMSAHVGGPAYIVVQRFLRERQKAASGPLQFSMGVCVCVAYVWCRCWLAAVVGARGAVDVSHRQDSSVFLDKPGKQPAVKKKIPEIAFCFIFR